MDIREAFKKQLEAEPMTPERLNASKQKRYSSGRKIEVGDRVLYAYLLIPTDRKHVFDIKMVRLHVDELDNYEVHPYNSNTETELPKIRKIEK